MNTVTFLLARRYLSSSSKHQTIASMVIISFISIFIGAFSLALVTAVMNGFEQTVHKKMQNIHPSASIYASGPIAVDAVKQVLEQEFPMITSISPTAIGHVLIQPQNEESEQPIVALIKGVDPQAESKTSAIGSKLHHKPLQMAFDENLIVLGKELAESVNVNIGDTITLYYIEPEQSHKKATISSCTATISDLFSTGIDEYDSGVIYSNLSFFEKLFPDYGITQIGLAFDQRANVSATIKQLERRLKLSVRTWQELYPALVSALVIEKYAMFLILLLITLVASMNVIALVFMLVTYKKSDIALLYALGMRPQEVQRLFILIGMALSFVASIIGIGTAWLCSVLLERYPFIRLPDAYYVTHLPAQMTAPMALLIVTIISIISFIACWHAARRVKMINVAQILRFEG